MRTSNLDFILTQILHIFSFFESRFEFTADPNTHVFSIHFATVTHKPLNISSYF